MSYASYVDPIEHAWRHCNPRAPLPSALALRAASSGSAVSLSSSPGQLAAGWSGTSQDIQFGLLTVATLPRISQQGETEHGQRAMSPLFDPLAN